MIRFKLLNFVFIFLLLLTVSTNKTSAAVCPSGASCVGLSRWDYPDGCEVGEVKDSEGNTLYYYYWQKYGWAIKSCDANCRWTGKGDICLGGAWDHDEPYVNFGVDYSGSCCTGASGGSTPCEPTCCKVPCGESMQGCGDGVLTCKKGYACGVAIGCGAEPPPPPTCVISGQSSITIDSEETTSYIVSVTPTNGTIDYVGFSSSNSSVATVNPTSDSSTPYSITVYGASEGTVSLTASAVMSGAVRCTITSSVTVLPNDPWWQVVDADVLASGNLTSKVPSSYLFDLVGSGGFPGAVIYSGTTNLTAAKTSAKKWLANSSIALSKTFNSTYFFNSLPMDMVLNEIENPDIDGSYFESGGEVYDGYYYYIYDGTSTGLPLNINSAMNLGTRKVILLVKGAGINFGGTVNLTKGSGFFLAVSAGDMSVASSIGNSSVYSLEGIYVTDGSFSTGTAGEEADTQLRVRGSVYAYGGMNLQRDLIKPGNSTTPAEYFEYAPDLELLFPTSLSYRPTHWQEVAP